MFVEKIGKNFFEQKRQKRLKFFFCLQFLLSKWNDKFEMISQSFLKSWNVV